MSDEPVEPKYAVGDQVKKSGGYRFQGEVRGVMYTTSGGLRYVVEHTDGWLFIFTESQLEPALTANEARSRFVAEMDKLEAVKAAVWRAQREPVVPKGYTPKEMPVAGKQETWLTYGEDAGYDRHIDMLTKIWHESPNDEDRELHDFLHMTWKQYQYYLRPKG